MVCPVFLKPVSVLYLVFIALVSSVVGVASAVVSVLTSGATESVATASGLVTSAFTGASATTLAISLTGVGATTSTSFLATGFSAITSGGLGAPGFFSTGGLATAFGGLRSILPSITGLVTVALALMTSWRFCCNSIRSCSFFSCKILKDSFSFFFSSLIS